MAGDPLTCVRCCLTRHRLCCHHGKKPSGVLHEPTRAAVAPGEPTPPPRYCFEQEPETRTRPKAIDLRAEAAKLESLLARRDELARAAEPVIAQCRAQYPE